MKVLRYKSPSPWTPIDTFFYHCTCQMHHGYLCSCLPFLLDCENLEMTDQWESPVEPCWITEGWAQESAQPAPAESVSPSTEEKPTSEKQVMPWPEPQSTVLSPVWQHCYFSLNFSWATTPSPDGSGEFQLCSHR